jgi:hypothetical protein
MGVQDEGPSLRRRRFEGPDYVPGILIADRRRGKSRMPSYECRIDRLAINIITAFQQCRFDECLNFGFLPPQRDAPDQVRQKANLRIKGRVDSRENAIPIGLGKGIH